MKEHDVFTSKVLQGNHLPPEKSRMNTEASPAPVPKETQLNPEKLLSEAAAGAQALLLLGIEPPKPDMPAISLQKDQLAKLAAEGIPPDHRKRLTASSFNERDEFWKDIPKDKRMDKWRESTNVFLDWFTKDQTKTAQQMFLKNTLKRDNLEEINADTLFGTFMQGEGKGDIEYFARRIVDTNSIADIEQNQELIKSLGKIYGHNAAKIGELLACGIANARHNLDKFTASAQEQLGKRAYGEDIWAPLAENALKWEEKQQTRKQQPVQTAQPSVQAPEPAKPEPAAAAKEHHPLVADAEAVSVKDAWKGVPNQDAYFVDREHGAFGVFDGLGGNIQGDVASITAGKSIEAQLAMLPANLSLSAAEEAVKSALTEASNKLWEVNEPRSRDLRLQYETKRGTTQLTDDDLAEIDSKSCMATTAAVVKLWQETEPDGAPKPNGQSKAVIVWAGDSRAYLLRSGQLERLTIDDTPLRDLVPAHVAKRIYDKHETDRYNSQEMRKTATVVRRSNPADKPLIEEIQRNPRGIAIPADPDAPIEVPYSYFDFSLMTESLSRGGLEPNSRSIDVQSGDRIIVTSDGIHDYVLAPEMADILNTPENHEAAKAAEALVKFAKRDEHRAPRDDATALVVNIK